MGVNMNYTKDQLQMMSDFERNKTLCTLLGKDVSGVCELRNQRAGAVTDYCNNPSDIMPLAFKYKVGINSLQNGGWEAYHPSTDIYYQSEEPLNAIVCCLILVLQEQQL